MNELFAGIDLGGTAVKAALADGTGSVYAEESIPTESHAGPAAVLQRTAGLVRQLSDQTGARVASVGMGLPGLVDVASGTAKFLPNLPTQWRDVPVAAMLSESLRCPVVVLNDVRTATLGELRFGHGRDAKRLTLAFFALGTGVGGGVAVDGQLRLGPLGAAGELGHQTILPDGPRCGCGNRGCLEALASGPAIAAEGGRLMRSGLAPELHAMVGGNADRITTREMAAAAAAGDELLREALIRSATYVGIAAANVVTILHPDMVVLGGGVAEIGDLLVDRVRAVVLERVGMFPPDGVRFERSLLGERAGVLGAVALARDGLPHA